MVTIVCALTLISFQLQPVASAWDDAPRGLYAQASQAIAEGNIDAAHPPLLALVEQHSESPLAEIAAFHLAECYLLRSQAADCLDILLEWTPRIAAQQTAEGLAPDGQRAWTSLWERALAQLPRDKISINLLIDINRRVNQLPDSGTKQKFQVKIAEELSRRFEAVRDYEQALLWMRRAVDTQGEQVSGPTLDRLSFQLPMLWARHALSTADTNQCITVLEQALMETQPVDRQIALKFLLAEALLTAGQLAQVEPQLEWLEKSGSSAEPVQDWKATVALRRAELLIARRKFLEAKELLQSAQQKYGQFEACYEFDYLLARCEIEAINFAQAEQHLRRVIDAPQAQGKEAAARATWLLGELFFLRHQYPTAVDFYRRVAAMDSFPIWQARAMLQAGKCHELLGQVSEALCLYAQVGEHCQAPELQLAAAERVATIRATYKDLR